MIVMHTLINYKGRIGFIRLRRASVFCVDVLRFASKIILHFLEPTQPNIKIIGFEYIFYVASGYKHKPAS